MPPTAAVAQVGSISVTGLLMDWEIDEALRTGVKKIYFQGVIV